MVSVTASVTVNKRLERYNGQIKGKDPIISLCSLGGLNGMENVLFVKKILNILRFSCMYLKIKLL